MEDDPLLDHLVEKWNTLPDWRKKEIAHLMAFDKWRRAPRLARFWELIGYDPRAIRSPIIIPDRRRYPLFPIPAMRRRGDERYRVSLFQRFGDSLKSESRPDPYTWSGLAGLGLLELTRPYA